MPLADRANERAPRHVDAAASTDSSKRPRSLGADVRRPFVWLRVAFAAITVGFFASTVYSEIRGSQIDRETKLIETNSLPSVEHVVAAEAALRRLEAAIQQRVRARGPAEEQRRIDASIDAARGDLLHALRAEETTGMYPGEADLTRAADVTLGDLDDAIARTPRGSPRGASAGRDFFDDEVHGAIRADRRGARSSPRPERRWPKRTPR